MSSKFVVGEADLPTYLPTYLPIWMKYALIRYDAVDLFVMSSHYIN